MQNGNTIFLWTKANSFLVCQSFYLNLKQILHLFEEAQ